MGLFDSIRRVVGGGAPTDGEDAATDSDPDDADLIDTRELDVTALRRQAEGVAAEVEQLDFSLGSLAQFDAAIEAGYDETLPTTDDPETYPRDVVRFGCYLGEVLVRAYGGRWEQDPEWGVTVSGTEDEATVAVFRVATRSITDEPVFAAVAERVAQEVGIETDDGSAEPAGDGPEDGDVESGADGRADEGSQEGDVETGAGEDDAVGTATPVAETDPDNETALGESGPVDDGGDGEDGDEPPTEAVDDGTDESDVDTEDDGDAADVETEEDDGDEDEDAADVESEDDVEDTAPEDRSERRPREPDALKSGFGSVEEPEGEAADDADEPTGTVEPATEAADDPVETDEPTSTEAFADKWGDDQPDATSDETDPPAETDGDVEADDPDGDDETEAAPDGDEPADSASAVDAAAETGPTEDVASLVEEAEPDADDEPWFEEAEPESTDAADETAAPDTERPASLFGGDESDADAMPPAEGNADSEDGAENTADEEPMPAAEASPAAPDPTEGDGLRAEYAEEADAFVTFWGEHDLDYSPDSLSRLDDLVAAEWDDDRFETATFQSDETFDDRAFTSVVTELGSYFGEVLVRDLDAEWSDRTANDSVIVDGVDGQLAIPVFRVAETSLRKSPVFARSYDSLLDDLGRN